jgi:hypothetical protein
LEERSAISCNCVWSLEGKMLYLATLLMYGNEQVLHLATLFDLWKKEVLYLELYMVFGGKSVITCSSS